MKVPPQEQGLALLTVLVMVAMIAAVSAIALERLNLSTRVAGNIAALDQARGYGYAVESIAISRVSDLAGRDVSRTTLEGGALGRDLALPIEGGSAVARVEDAGNCFNLNSVVEGDVAKGLSIRPAGMTQLRTLIQIIGGAPRAGDQIAAALADWIDSDTLETAGGAEDGAYARAETPHRAANTLIADPGELRHIAGVTPELYARLRPFICALPVSDLSPINVNTLTPAQAPLIAMLFSGRIDLAAARSMIDARPRGGYASAVEFWNLSSRQGITPPAEAVAQPQVKTRWFEMDLQVQLAGAELRERALIDGAQSPAKLVRRVYGDPE